VGPLGEQGVPLLDVRTDAAPYFDLHHTANDTFDKVDPELLRQNVAAYATLACLAAQYSGDFGRALKPKRARVTSSRTIGTTAAPNSSMLSMSAGCGSVPALYFMLKRERPSALMLRAIFAATVAGAPTHRAPEAPASCSKCSRVTGGQPRSAPILVIIAS
jgi:hypothetical protein